MKQLLIPVALWALSGLAAAHVTLEEPAAIAGQAYKATLRVGHGCEGTATHTLRVLLPESFRGAKPMPKPGWTLEVGRAASGEGSEISWKANSRESWLADAHYDEFVLRGRTPVQAGPIWFKVQQLCEKGQLDWFDTPTDPGSTDRSGLKSPAALLEVLPGMGSAGSDTHRH